MAGKTDGNHGTGDRKRLSYVRVRHLPHLIPLWPGELEDESAAGRRRLLRRLHRALRSERKRGEAGHWAYDLNRHRALLHACKAEAAALEVGPKTD